MSKNRSSIRVIILSDGKKGHLNQSLALAESLSDHVEMITIQYKSGGHRLLLDGLSYMKWPQFISKILVKYVLKEDILLNHADSRHDPREGSHRLLISTGSSLSSLNLILSKILHAKSIHMMKAPWGKRFRFDLHIVPQHDHPRPAKNTLVTVGALNRISKKRLEIGTKELSQWLSSPSKKNMSVFIGGNTPFHKLSSSVAIQIIGALDHLMRTQDMDLFITMSQRTPKAISDLFEEHFKPQLGAGCRLLITPADISSQPAHLMEGMLAIADLVLVTSDSISMMSEAASAGKKMVIIESPTQSRSKHSGFVENLRRDGYAWTSSIDALSNTASRLLSLSLPPKPLQDVPRIKAALHKLL